MFSQVHEMGIIANGATISPFVACYLCSYTDETGQLVFAWVMEDVLRITSPLLHMRAIQHGFSALANCDKQRIPPIPLPGCHWIELQRRAIIILSMINDM